MSDNEKAIVEAALKLFASQTVSSSTLPPGQYGIGGQMITGWVSAETVRNLMETIEDAERQDADIRRRVQELFEARHNA